MKKNGIDFISMYEQATPRLEGKSGKLRIFVLNYVSIVGGRTIDIDMNSGG